MEQFFSELSLHASYASKKLWSLCFNLWKRDVSVSLSACASPAMASSMAPFHSHALLSKAHCMLAPEAGFLCCCLGWGALGICGHHGSGLHWLLLQSCVCLFTFLLSLCRAQLEGLLCLLEKKLLSSLLVFQPCDKAPTALEPLEQGKGNESSVHLQREELMRSCKTWRARETSWNGTKLNAFTLHYSINAK